MAFPGARWFLLACGLIVSCGDDLANADSDGEEQEELATICGEPGPFRLFAFAADEWISPYSSIRRHGERLYFPVEPERPYGWAEPATPITSALYSTGLCGEDRRLVARDVSGTFARARWPDTLLACGGLELFGGQFLYHDLLVVDPGGVAPPKIVSEGVCTGRETADGVIVEEDRYTDGPAGEPHRVLYHPYPDDPLSGPVPPAVLFEVIDSSTLRVLDHEVFAVDLDGALVRADLAAWSFSVEEVGVRDFDVSPDGRFLAWHAQAPPGDPEAPSPVYLRDRDSGVDTEVAFDEVHRIWQDDDRLLLHLGPERRERVVFVPSLATFDLPVDRRLVSPVDDGRWLTSVNPDLRGPFHLRELESGEETMLFDGTGSGRNRGTHLDILVDGADEVAEPGLWRYGYDGSPPQQLARRANSYRLLPDGRVLASVELDGRGRETLVLVDPVTLDEQVVATGVYDGEFALADPEIYGDALGDDVIVYTILEDEQKTIYLARLPPP